ncbi:hypothetical protein HYPSUDRAFT_205836 [Hypholoma sublateritium FD-334 SS-4]|uniref:Uncharacterized protein n=1 Tax=Hypholoma sublateritium (strain FD-334 SS-4) TaxID=945553 RepID=A0A0D2NMD0_HYPSF|nr:hypothetical protein HYPSUDRAFT_205836 [Hypholoma sublateritium FD-334 SS-4]
MAPRPILKRAPAAADARHYQHHHAPAPTPAVHFPPSPALTRTFSAYSAAAYDRSPIVVSPNSCALPERGCPGRTYTLEEQRPRAIALARDYHPRALAFAAASQSSMPPVPALVPDLSSESDESDAPSVPAELGAAYYPPPATSPPKGHPFALEDPAARCRRLRPAPLAPSPSFEADDDAPPSPTQPRRRRERRHESSRDPDRIPSEAPSASPPRRKGVRRPTALAPPALLAAAGFGAPDDGCLGGF